MFVTQAATAWPGMYLATVLSNGNPVPSHQIPTAPCGDPGTGSSCTDEDCQSCQEG